MSRKGDQLPVEEGRAGALCIGDGEGDLLSPLGTYSPCSVGELGHSNWVVECAKAIYPTVEISCEGHKYQMFALLTFLEEERRARGVGCPLQTWFES